MKKIYGLLIGLFALVSCSNGGTSFDSDFVTIKDNLLHGESFITLEKKEDSLYDYEFNYLDIKFKAYYTELSTDYSYAFVLTLSYSKTRIENIRCLVVSINDDKTTFAQVGFDGVKKNIDSYNNSSSATYKGIQTFVTPFSSNTSTTRFYFESTSFSGSYFQINDVREVK